MQLTEADIIAIMQDTKWRWDYDNDEMYVLDWQRRAAHAIAEAEAEKMAEGVVAEQRYIIRHADYPDPAAAHMICSYLTMVGTTGPGHEGEYIWLGNERIGKDAQLVEVTVRVKEE